MSDLSAEKLDELAATLERATQGPFKVERVGRGDLEIGAETPAGHMSVAWVHLGERPTPLETMEGLRDAMALAEALTAAPALIAEVRRHRAALSPREEPRMESCPGCGSRELHVCCAPAPSLAQGEHVCGNWRLSPSLEWVCGSCGKDAPPLPQPGYGDPIRVACPSCDAPGFTRSELVFHRCASAPSGTREEP